MEIEKNYNGIGDKIIMVEGKHPKVSIIVLNYNGKKWLDNCFQSLAEVDYPDFEVVMVDNDSTDDSVEYVRKKYDWVRVIESGRNGGFAFGMNTGIKGTQGEYVFLLDTDTIATKDFLHRLVEVAELDPDIIVASASSINPFNSPLRPFAECDPSTGIASASLLHTIYSDYMNEIKNSRKDKVRRADTVSGAMMLIKRKLMEDIGPLDETFFMYWEDTEFNWRANLMGYKVVNVRDAAIYHLISTTSIDTGFVYSKMWVYEFIKNKIYAHLKLRSIFYLFLFLPSEAIRSFARIFYYGFDKFPAIIRAWKWNLLNLRETYAKRKKIMKRKKISDWDLFKLMMNSVIQERDFNLFPKVHKK
jgi:GT2 family glycosyltransferase